MPRPRKNVREVELIKQRILEQALDLMSRHGFDGFSMRKLGSRLGVSAKTIYNYYQNKDEIYLAILTRGFSELYDRFEKTVASYPDPLERLKQMGRAYLNFGLEQANIYNLMFTWHVPKFKDYVGTPVEKAARIELETALTVSDIFMKAIMAASGDNGMTETAARFHMIAMWSQMHGFIAGINNTLLDYMHENPLALKERMLDEVHEKFLFHIQDINCASAFENKRAH